MIAESVVESAALAWLEPLGWRSSTEPMTSGQLDR